MIPVYLLLLLLALLALLAFLIVVIMGEVEDLVYHHQPAYYAALSPQHLSCFYFMQNSSARAPSCDALDGDIGEVC